MKNICPSFKFDIDINTSASSQNSIDCPVIVGFNSFRKFCLMVLDLFLNCFGSANRPFFVYAFVIFKYPSCNGAIFAKELFT